MAQSSAISKQSLRAQYRQVRRSLSSQAQQAAALQLQKQMLSSGMLTNQQHVAVYLHQDGEISCEPIVTWCWRNNIQTYLPVLDVDNAGHLLFLPYAESTKLKNNQYQIPEPPFDPQAVIDVSQLSLIVLPLVAFDLSGNRLGMGGGFYDRTLSRKLTQNAEQSVTLPTLCGVAHDCQQATQIDTESWDVPLDAIITPSKVISLAQ